MKFALCPSDGVSGSLFSPARVIKPSSADQKANRSRITRYAPTENWKSIREPFKMGNPQAPTDSLLEY